MRKNSPLALPLIQNLDFTPQNGERHKLSSSGSGASENKSERKRARETLQLHDPPKRVCARRNVRGLQRCASMREKGGGASEAKR